MPLAAIMDSVDDLSPDFKSLYTERNGKWELTGITGVKTQADVDRLNTALAKERDDHKGTKDRFGVWGELDYNETMAKLDRLPELEAAAAGKLDDAAIEEMVAKRVDGKLQQATGPLERKLQQTTANLEAITAERDALAGEKTQRIITDDVRKALVDKKVLPEAQEDALMLAERIFEITEDGKVVTKDGVGVTPGIPADVWLTEIQDKRPHWWPASGGGGASGGAGGAGGGSNPWAADTWNMTKQGQYLNQHGREKADQMAKLAGTTVGGRRPTKK